MRYSQSFWRTKKETPKQADSLNAQLLERGGFIHQEAAGVYSFLTLGLRVLVKIEDIVREEMNKIGAQEILMPALHPKKNWEITGRWESFDALFKIEAGVHRQYALGPTHEEIIYPLLKEYISSYKNLPVAVYQIQTKFRDEKRAKSGLLRGREFRMKDLYSFHATDEDRDRYYNTVRQAYLRCFRRLGLSVLETKASGGTFSDLSLEYQVLADTGEDTIFVCKNCNFAVNAELNPKLQCEKCGLRMEKKKSIEVGNIFPLKEKYAHDFHLVFKDRDGREKYVSAGCYGLGTTRVMGALVEVIHDDKGIIWPVNVAPFHIYLLTIPANSHVQKQGEEIYAMLRKLNFEVFFDDRQDVSAGEKFADADLIGIPVRIVVSEKTDGRAELTERRTKKSKIVALEELPAAIKDMLEEAQKLDS